MFVGAGLLCARRLGQLVVVQPALLQLVDGSDAEQFGVRPQCWLVRGDQIRFERIVAAQLNGCLPETSTLEHRLCVAGCVLCVWGWAGLVPRNMSHRIRLIAHLVQIAQRQLVALQVLHLRNRQRCGAVGVLVLRNDVLLASLVGGLDNRVLRVRLDGQLDGLAGGGGPAAAAHADHGAAHVAVVVADAADHTDGRLRSGRHGRVLGLLFDGNGAHNVAPGTGRNCGCRRGRGCGCGARGARITAC